MKKAILGRKLGMTQYFTEKGEAVPVTVIEAGPCVVVQKKTVENDGYEALKVGFVDVKENRLTKPLLGQFKKYQLKPKKYIREIKIDEMDKYNVGDEIKVDIFKPGDRVDVTGISIGKGFAGGVKRWNFNRGPMSHGSMYHRRPGSGGATDPERVFKGKRMPGHLGHERVTVQNLEIVKVDPERNIMLVKGSVPGIKKSLLYIKSTVKGGK
ncbi:50S ribosomal protein L3 [Thermovenabulum gondwanense]|uniref:Large ribosomal subunit protein uL3 n=1 Tax=Thermovenabulum gondwanense TaxID=520767 RepID=A0A162M4C3_9FIRM|nr:50S ribosomal protein L3 [Thermovenabulum gondwanense]KYO63931.1 50S ribosomal protein L3 [Thermovenabulum gondwanense]